VRERKKEGSEVREKGREERVYIGEGRE